jgi:ankyrin repeat protein
MQFQCCSQPDLTAVFDLIYAVLPCRACSAGRLDSARALVEGGKARLEAKDASGATPMGVAASCGDQTMTLYLLSKGADPEVCKSAFASMLPASPERVPLSWADHALLASDHAVRPAQQADATVWIITKGCMPILQSFAFATGSSRIHRCLFQ